MRTFSADRQTDDAVSVADMVSMDIIQQFFDLWSFRKAERPKTKQFKCSPIKKIIYSFQSPFLEI